MTERLVINTGPLIALARIDALEMTGQLPIEFLCPFEVRAELDAGAAVGHVIVQCDWLQVVSVQPPSFSLPGLDMGESSVIQLALEREIETVAIDEWKGRRAALSLGLKVTGVLGLLGRAKALGLTAALRPWIERAVEAGIHYHPRLLDEVLAAAGE